mgnify:CR=1 FL=1
MKNFYLLFTALLFLSSCQKDEIALPVSTGSTSNTLEAAREWFETNPEENNFNFLNLAKELSWDKAESIELDNYFVVEIPITIKENILSSNSEGLFLANNRLLIINSNNKYKSYLFNSFTNDFTFKKLIENEKNYFKRNILITDTNNRLVELKAIFGKNTSKILPNSYKYMALETRCYEWIEIFSDGSTRRTGSGYCYEDGGSYTSPYYNENDHYPNTGSGTYIPATEEDKINSEELTGKEKCLNDLLDKEGNSYVQELLKQFKGESEFDIEIESVDQIWNPEKQKYINAQTFPPENNIIKIQISSRETSRSALAVARTILHEYIHADIFRKLNTQLVTTDKLDFKTTFEKYESDHHETMGQLYIRSMTNALKIFHKEVLSEDYDAYSNYFGVLPSDNFYSALAWQGLKNHNVKAYTDLPQSEKDAISVEEQNLSILKKDCPQN